jgi:putative FmdB family regulatory protein
MPLYEYECNDCQHRFEIRQGFHDKPLAECPKCKAPSRRVFHPTPIIFKGSGFYVTDHRAPMKEPGSGMSKTDTASGTNKTDTGPGASKGDGGSEKSKGETGAGKSTK